MPAQKLNRAIKYRAYPTPEQRVLFAKTFGCVRFVWNRMLADAQTFLDETGVVFIPTPAKYKKEFPFLKEIDSGALCNAQLDLKEARKRHKDIRTKRMMATLCIQSCWGTTPSSYPNLDG